MNTKYEGITNYPSNFNVNISRPLDTRQVIESLDLLTKPKSTFGGYAYNGMVVSVPEEGLFVLNNFNESKADSTEYNDKSIIGDDILKEYGWNRLLTTEVPGIRNTHSDFITLNNLRAVIHTNYDSDLRQYTIQNDTHIETSYISLTNNVLDVEDNIVNYSKMTLYDNCVSFFILNTKGADNSDYRVFNIEFGHDTVNKIDNTLFKITHNPVSLESKVTGSIIATSESETINDNQLVSVGYLNKKLEEFTPKIQSQLKMYVYDIDDNGNTSTGHTGDVANIQIVRETNGTLTFEVEDTISLERLAGSSQDKVLDYLQFTITDKDSNGTLHPSDDIATVKVVRNVSGKMSIRIS